MRKSSILLAGIGTMAGLGMLQPGAVFDFEGAGHRTLRFRPAIYHPCRKTVTAAALKRAAKKRRIMRARSRK